MKNRIVINKEFQIGEIERDLWGSFIEHMGRAIYGGIYDPENACADQDGFRNDVKETVRELRIPKIRYPGGNFLSGYDWRNGIGKNRPVKLDLAWGQLEPNIIGLHEFYKWAEEVGSEVMMSVNMGTGTPQSAAELVEYCNFPKGTQLSDLRRQNGREKPFNIKTWCIGNEMDGDWQICALTADEYGRKATETAKMMRWVDKDIRLVVCGSSSAEQKTYPEWDRVVLQHTYDYIDYLSLHRYYTYTKSLREEDLMSSHTDLDRFIKKTVATADYVQAYKRGKKQIKLSLDEWNVWHTRPAYENKVVYNSIDEDKWTVGPRRIENNYDLTDAVTFAGLVCTLINNADRVKMGCLAQLVNVIAPIMTENGGGMYKQTTYYPFAMAIRYAKGAALRLIDHGEKMDSDYGETEKVYAACAYEKGEYNLFIINKTAQKAVYDMDFQVMPVQMTERLEMSGGLHESNTFERPDHIVPRRMSCDEGKKSVHTVSLPAYSFTLLRFSEE